MTEFFAQCPDLTPEQKELIQRNTNKIVSAMQDYEAATEAWLAEMERVGGQELATSLRQMLEADDQDGGDRVEKWLRSPENDRTLRLWRYMNLKTA
jgi:hypothetical protein